MMANRDGADADERWTLHASDRALLGNKAGATRLGFTVLLKMFQADGRFPHRLEEVPRGGRGDRPPGRRTCRIRRRSG